MSGAKTHLKILVVEDNPEDREIYKRFLKQCEEFECSILECETGEEGVELCAREKPDCAILDYNLPDVNGIELLSTLKRNDFPGAIIMLTGSGSEQIAANSIKEGAHDYLVKDFLSPAAFYKAITSSLKMSEMSRRKKVAEEELKVYKEWLEDRVEERTAELKAAHKQLLHAEKLSATGKLAASIAHEFNNPIYGIRNVLAQIREEFALGETHERLVDMAIKECARIAELIRKLQDFHRPTDGVVSPADIHQIIDDMILLTGKKLKERKIQLEKNYAPGLPKIKVVADQIKQVMLNLIQNAEEAIPDGGGKIAIATKAQPSAIQIQVRDTGCGIAPETMKLIFDPFFTTKPQVKGTGLGLSVSYGIIKKHGGELEVTSELGKGATFTVTLPYTRESE